MRSKGVPKASKHSVANVSPLRILCIRLNAIDVSKQFPSFGIATLCKFHDISIWLLSTCLGWLLHNPSTMAIKEVKKIIIPITKVSSFRHLLQSHWHIKCWCSLLQDRKCFLRCKLQVSIVLCYFFHSRVNFHRIQQMYFLVLLIWIVRSMNKAFKGCYHTWTLNTLCNTINCIYGIRISVLSRNWSDLYQVCCGSWYKLACIASHMSCASHIGWINTRH